MRDLMIVSLVPDVASLRATLASTAKLAGDHGRTQARTFGAGWGRYWNRGLERVRFRAPRVPSQNFLKPTEGPIRMFTVGLGNR